MKTGEKYTRKNIPCMSDCNWDEEREKHWETVIAFRLNLVTYVTVLCCDLDDSKIWDSALANYDGYNN